MRTKNLTFMDTLATDRIAQKINTYNNNNFIIEYMIKNNITAIKNNLNIITLKELKEHNNRIKQYLKNSGVTL